MGDEKERSNDPAVGPGGPDARDQAEGKAPSFEVPPILQLGDPRELMDRLIEEDPFELRSRCSRCSRARAVILSPERLVLQTMARVAVKAGGFAGEEPFGEWLERIVKDCIEDLLDEQREEERRGLPVADSPDSAFYAALAEVLECPVCDARMACVSLNSMSDAHREAFHAVIVQGNSLEEWARKCGVPQKRVRALLREVGQEVGMRLEKRSRARRRRPL